MGDVVELSTWPEHHNNFYRISSNALSFEVKGRDSATIGLCKRIGFSCDFWVVIGQANNSWIRRHNGGGHSAISPDIINNREYKKFWLTWNNGMIQLGRGESLNALVTYPSNGMDLSYVTFMSGDSNPVDPIYWRLELPPMLPKPKLIPITGGKLYWVPAETELPEGALIGGYEKETLYIIRANHMGSRTPGKYVPSRDLGYIPWGGTANEKSRFEVLCGFNCLWVAASDDRIPVGAFEGGYSENPTREILYIGRGMHNGHLIPGKVQPSHRVCYIPYENREIGLKKYEILVSPEQNARCCNKLCISHIEIDSPPESDNDDNDDYEYSD